MPLLLIQVAFSSGVDQQDIKIGSPVSCSGKHVTAIKVLENPSEHGVSVGLDRILPDELPIGVDLDQGNVRIPGD